MFRKAPNRQLLKDVFKNPQTLRDFESLFEAGVDVQNQIDDIQEEVDRVETGAGLETDGTYIVPTGTRFLDSSASLANATQLLDDAIPDNVSYKYINEESDFNTIVLSLITWILLEDNTVYVLRKPISFTMGFAASGVYTGTVFFLTQAFDTHTFTNVDNIILGNGTNRFFRLLANNITITGTADSCVFSKDPTTPTQIGTFNFNNSQIIGLEMGSSKGTIIHKNSNIINQKGTWDLQVAGLNFVFISGVFPIGDPTGFTGNMIKISGNTAGTIILDNLNCVPGNGSKMFDFTELLKPTLLTTVSHITILGSGGMYGNGTDKTITAFADAGGGKTTVTSVGHNIPDGREIIIKDTTNYNNDTSITAFATGLGGSTIVTATGHGFSWSQRVQIIGTTSYNGFFEIINVNTNDFTIKIPFVANDATGTVSGSYITSNKTTDTFEIEDAFVANDATGIANVLSVDFTDPLLTVVGANGPDNIDSDIIGSFAFVDNMTSTTNPGKNVWSKIGGTTYPLENEDCSMTGNNQLTFENLEQKKRRILMTFSVLTGSGGNDSTFQFRIMKNGIPLQINAADQIVQVSTNSSNPETAVLHTTETVITGDVFEVWQRCTSSNTRTLLVTDGQFTID